MPSSGATAATHTSPQAKPIDTRPALFPKQERMFVESTARINIAWGSVRSGKSYGLEFFRWPDYVLRAPAGDLLMAGKTLKTLERNVLRPMKRLWGTRWSDYSTGKKEAQMFGRRVELEGGNNEEAQDKIQGMTLAGAMINEAALVPKSFWNQVLGRMSVPDAKLFATTNPDSPYHWLKSDYIDRAEDLDLRMWHFTLAENEYLDDAYVQSLKNEYTGVWYKRYIQGRWVLAEGSIYDMFSEDKHVGGCPIDPSGVETWRVPVDYGTSNPTTFALHGYWHDGGDPHGHCFDEYYHSGREDRQKTDEQYVDALVDFIPDRLTDDVVVVVDPSAASFITACEERGLDVEPAENDVLDGIRFVSSMLADGRYTIDPSCEHTIREYQSYVWDEKAQQRGEDKPKKEHDHCPDRDRYGLFTTLWPGREQHHFGGDTVTL